ncbi:MAG: bacillithiol biosynthesis cysteine-adding enzyme BshC [bacterium]|jgi:bacillithiol biosynthesis cysteine-adding enzyme BshC|nr:bacillithiol biosynthesis cysteine-adding enzyme BshC [bacterium]
MEILRQWDTTAALVKSPYVDFLHEPPQTLKAMVPPSLAALPTVLEAREAFIEAQIDRHSMAQALRESHLRRGAPPSALLAIEKLRQPKTYLVVTGQQPGLLCGPLYSFYKILQAINLARRLSRENEGTFLPAFWDAAEDHDFDEIATVQWLSKDRTLERFTWPKTLDPRRPLYAIPAAECPVEALLDQIRQTIHATEFMEPLMGEIRDAWLQSASYPDWIDRLIWMLFPEEGLIVLRPDDGYVREHAVRLLAREMAEPVKNSRLIESAGEVLQAQGLTPQVHKRAERTAFFLIEDGARLPVFFANDHFYTDAGQEMDPEELARCLRECPAHFSPSAVLRPVVQDAVFPVAAVVLGPGEMGYHFLLNGVYAWHGVPRPCVVPRTSLTLVEKRDFKLLEKLGLSPEDCAAHPAALVKSLTRGRETSDWMGDRNQAMGAIHAFFAVLEKQAKQIDPTILPVLKKNQSRIVDDLMQSEDLLVRRTGEKDEMLRRQCEGLHTVFFPNENGQERELNFFAFYLKYGPDFLHAFKTGTKSFPDGSRLSILIP